MLHLVPQWQSAERHRKLKVMMQDRPDLIKSELAGLAFDSLQQVFRKTDIDDLFAATVQCVEEAIVNAIVHGNKLDPAKTVRVSCAVTPQMARIEITDAGVGFDPAAVPDCTRDERLEVPSGRGVMLMRSFMTTIAYNARGNSVLLEKQRTPHAG